MASEKTHPMALRMPEKLLKTLDTEAKRQGRSRAGTAVRLLAKILRVKL